LLFLYIQKTAIDLKCLQKNNNNKLQFVSASSLNSRQRPTKKTGMYMQVGKKNARSQQHSAATNLCLKGAKNMIEENTLSCVDKCKPIFLFPELSASQLSERPRQRRRPLFVYRRRVPAACNRHRRH
jgi:hypothetical protein